MGIGDSINNAITSAINVIGSTATITAFTQSSDDEGYSGQVETTTSTTTELAIPFEEFKKLLKESFGDLETAGLQIAFKSTATFDIQGTTKYKITYNGDEYDIVEPKRFAIEDTLVAWIVSISKRFD